MMARRSSTGGKTRKVSGRSMSAAVTALGILCMSGNGQSDSEERDCGEAEISICGFHIFGFVGNLNI